ncbi:MAG: sortase [Ilumatobacteraceae bacterium]
MRTSCPQHASVARAPVDRHIVGQNVGVRGPTARRISASVAAVACAGALAACSGSSGTREAVATPSTIADSTTTSTTTSSSTSTTSTTTTTIYSGPPTLAPGATLPVPVYPPGKGAVDPEIYIGEIEIPAIMMKSSINFGVTDATFDRGVGWWPDTAKPGDVGNVVLGGHRTSWPRPFRYVDLLEPGDEIVFTTEAGRFVYAVSRTEVVYPDAIWIVDQTEEATVTLFACHPVGSTAQRIVIFADYVRQDV